MKAKIFNTFDDISLYPINEMAIPRKEFKDKIEALLDQIIENWCLVHYCTLAGQTQYKEHWKHDELETYLEKCMRYKIQGNNSYNSRLKVLKEIFNGIEFNSDPNVVNLTVRGKFRKENIDMTSDIYNQCINDCVKESDKIIELIAKADIEAISDYLETI